MNARAATTCVQCKAAEAVAVGFFADLGNTAAGLPWCQSCMTEVVPVLLWWGYPVNLVSADRPAGLEICHYGECPRLCRAGRRACDDHLTELREVYAGKESGASVDPELSERLDRYNRREAGEDIPAMPGGAGR